MRLSIITRAKKDLLKKILTRGLDPIDKALDDWFDEWIQAYYGKGTVVPEDGGEYRDDPKQLEHVRSILKTKISRRLRNEEIYEETSDIDRKKRLIQIFVFVMKEPEKMLREEPHGPG